MNVSQSKRLYIIGAGFAGTALARELKEKAVFGRVVAFLDDDPEKIGRNIGGVPVLGPIQDVAKLLRMNPADEAIIAIPSASRENLSGLYAALKGAGFARIRILPGISQIVEGDPHLIQTRSIDPQDLLGRTAVTVNLRESLSYLRGKRVLVTGAGGSIGSELCRQLLSGGASRLYLLGHGENSIYLIDRELRLLQEEGVGEKDAVLVPIIGDLKDCAYVDWLLGRLKADVVFHAAAYKHVPMMEENPVAAIENNFFGTDHLVKAARKHGVKRFVLITTDKAVDPVSVYGASKQLCERLVLEAAASSGLNFMVVRFGNVLGSRGSILPLFQRQIEKGGPVTVTHREMRRWFMTIPEACSLVLKAGGVGENGGLYLLDMGEPVWIRELAEQLIRFYGFEPERDIKIEYVGLRPGERLDERLWGEDEEPRQTEFNRILRVERKRPYEGGLAALREELLPVCFFDPGRPEGYRDAGALLKALERVIPTIAASVDPATGALPDRAPHASAPADPRRGAVEPCGAASGPPVTVAFAKPSIGKEEEEAVLGVLRSGWLTTGKEALAFEAEFAAFLETPGNPPLQALAVNSATSGLHLALEALGVGPGDLVLSPSYTFTATAEVVHYLGAETVFVDVAPGTFHLDPNALERTLARLSRGLSPYPQRGGCGPRGRPRALIPVHYGGLPCDMKALRGICRRYGLGIIEDAAHSFPSLIPGSALGDGGADAYAGTLGEAGVFSFYATKPLTTGEGGMVVTRDRGMAERIGVMRSHGIDRTVWSRYTDQRASWYYEVIEAGFKDNLPDILAALGRVQLRRGPALLERRRAIARHYDGAFGGDGRFCIPPTGPGDARHLYPLRLRGVAGRDAFIRGLQGRGIGVSVHFIPLHIMPYYRERYGLEAGDFPESVRSFEGVISLPIWPDMGEGEVERVIGAVRGVAEAMRG